MNKFKKLWDTLKRQRDLTARIRNFQSRSKIRLSEGHVSEEHLDRFGRFLKKEYKIDLQKKLPKLGSGERFKNLVEELKKKGYAEGEIGKAFLEKRVYNPEALAAWIGRRKYGKAKFQEMAAAGKK